jgi:Tfp pilus assembly protein PilF
MSKRMCVVASTLLAFAPAIFEKVLQMAPVVADWLAEIGSYYLVKGDRKHAEEFFQRSLTADPDNQRNVLRMAGAFWVCSRTSSAIEADPL